MWQATTIEEPMNPMAPMPILLPSSLSSSSRAAILPSGLREPTLRKQAACLRSVGSRNPDGKIAALEDELKELGNSIGMGAMGFMGSSMVVACHIEVGYCHTGGMPMSVHMFCLSSRRVPQRPAM